MSLRILPPRVIQSMSIAFQYSVTQRRECFCCYRYHRCHRRHGWRRDFVMGSTRHKGPRLSYLRRFNQRLRYVLQHALGIKRAWRGQPSLAPSSRDVSFSAGRFPRRAVQHGEMRVPNARLHHDRLPSGVQVPPHQKCGRGSNKAVCYWQSSVPEFPASHACQSRRKSISVACRLPPSLRIENACEPLEAYLRVCVARFGESVVPTGCRIRGPVAPVSRRRPYNHWI